MRYYVLTFLILFFFQLNAQNYSKLIEKESYKKVGKKLSKKIEKDPSNAELLYFYSVLKYKVCAGEYFDISSSYDTYLEAKQSYTNINDIAVLEKLNKIPINIIAFRALSDSICRIAFEHAKSLNTEEAHIYYLSKYDEAPSFYKEQAVLERNRLGFNNAVTKNTFESFTLFINKYPKAIQLEEAWGNIHRIEYDKAKELHSIEAYQAFIRNYPSADQRNDAQENIHTIAFEKAKEIDNSKAYESFIDRYPSSKQKDEALGLFYDRQFGEETNHGNWESFRNFYLTRSGPYKTIAADSVLAIARRSGNPKIWLFCFDSKIGDKDEVVKSYYNLISKDGELSSLLFFNSYFNKHTYLISTLQEDLQLARTANDIGLTSEGNISQVNTEMSKRLKREGAKSGAITISLMWNNYNDIDLHCIDPFGEEIFFSNKTSDSGGELDVDMNAGGPSSMEPVENIYWENGNAKQGKYRIYVNHYRNHDCGYQCYDPTEFTVVIKNNFVIKEFTGSISYGQRKRLIYEFNFSDLEYGQVDLTAENKVKIENYIKNANGKELAFVGLQKLIADDLDRKLYTSALRKAKEFRNFFLDNEKYEQLLDILEDGIAENVNIFSIEEINSESGQEYSPVITADSKKLFFCGYDRGNSIGGEDIFMSERINEKWSLPELVRGLSNAETNDALMAISADGNRVLIFENGKLAFRSKTVNGWSDLQYFSSEINNCLWNGDAMFSSDGNALIFASVRQQDGFGVNNSHNEFYHSSQRYYSDIYVSTFENEKWSTPRNLGPKINTIYAERSPFLHPDMKTLYFSSDGHGGLGNLDVFMSTRISDSCWDCWSDPINLGRQINSINDDWGYRISTDGKVAYFSKDSETISGEDIYSITLPPHLRPDVVAKIEGTLKDLNDNPVAATIRWEDLESNKVIGTAKSDPSSGEYFIVLPMGKNYGYFIEDTAYFPISRNLDLRDKSDAIEINNAIVAVTFQEMIEKKIPIPMNNLFFEFGKSTILRSSIPELRRVADIIKSKNLSVELSGHTDNVGSESMNQKISEDRAKRVKEFLIQAGVETERIITKGYGFSIPIDTNETEEGRTQNRRVEIRLSE